MEADAWRTSARRSFLDGFISRSVGVNINMQQYLFICLSVYAVSVYAFPVERTAMG